VIAALQIWCTTAVLWCWPPATPASFGECLARVQLVCSAEELEASLVELERVTRERGARR
jgi:hypothetical protein